MSAARAPLAPPAIAFAAGIALAPLIRIETAWTAGLAAFLWSVSLLVLERPGWAAASLLVGVAAAGTIRATTPPPPADDVSRLRLPTVARVEGRLVAEPVRFAPDRARLLIDVARVDGQPRSGRLLTTIHGEGLGPLAEGQRVEATLRLHRAIGFRNPGVFDYGAWLQRQGIRVVGTGRPERLAALDGPAPPWPARVRRAIREVMARVLPPASAALLRGLVLGDRTDLPREIDQAFRRAGVYHVLAVSGFNVGLVAGAVWAVLTLARAGRRGAALGAVVAVVGFALVVGPEPSVLRAAVMAVLVLGALVIDREAAVINSLALAALIILAVRPRDLTDPGFQLSFAATAGIVLAPLPRRPFAGALGVSLAAQLAVLPITLVHFNQLSTIAPVANLAVVPLAALATVLGLLGTTLAAVTEIGAAILLNAAWPVLLALRALVAAAAAVPGAVLHLPAPHWTAVASYFLALGLALLAWRLTVAGSLGGQRALLGLGFSGRLRGRGVVLAAAGAGASLAMAVAIAAWPLLRPPDGWFRLTVLDVGQGDAIVVEAPDGSAALIDAGGGGPRRLDAGERVVAPFLWNRGILTLAVVVGTHADLDHAGGLPTIRTLFTPRTTWDATTPPPHRFWLGGVSVQVLSPRQDAAAGGWRARGFRPPAAEGPPWGRGGSRNEEAIVLRIDHGLASFLLASDIGAPTEMWLIASAAPLGATVLKVAHHGSRDSTTSEFLDRVRPALAVISVGPRNAYGHPAPPTLARLAAAGARIYRTDHDGAVIFETDGARLSVTRWAARTVDRYCLDPDRVC